jgi:hypothetical protein
MTARDREPLDPEVAALLGPEHDPPDVPADVRERVFSRVVATRAAGGNGGDGGNGSGGADRGGADRGGAPGDLARRIARGAALRGGLLGFLLGGLAGAGVHAALSTPGAPTPAPMVAATTTPAPSIPERGKDEAPPVPSAEAPPPAAAATAAETRAAPSSSAASRAALPPDAGASTADPELAKERALVQMARTALLQGQSAAALAALDQHAREFPRGRLGEERDALVVQALAAAGRRDEARARAEQFRKAHPKSILLPVVEAASAAAP